MEKEIFHCCYTCIYASKIDEYGDIKCKEHGCIMPAEYYPCREYEYDPERE